MAPQHHRCHWMRCLSCSLLYSFDHRYQAVSTNVTGHFRPLILGDCEPLSGARPGSPYSRSVAKGHPRSWHRPRTGRRSACASSAASAHGAALTWERPGKPRDRQDRHRHARLRRGGQPTDTMNLVIDPGVEIPAEAIAVHGITIERARAAGLKLTDAMRVIVGRRPTSRHPVRSARVPVGRGRGCWARSSTLGFVAGRGLGRAGSAARARSVLPSGRAGRLESSMSESTKEQCTDITCVPCGASSSRAELLSAQAAAFDAP